MADSELRAGIYWACAKGYFVKAKNSAVSDDMRREYRFDYSKVVRGRYYRRLLKEGANVVVLEPEVAKAFRDSAAVNEALRLLIQLRKIGSGKTRGA